MVRDFESGKHALQELIGWYAEHADSGRNEASTRFHIIDRLLSDVLAWPKDSINVEHHHDGTYSDYELGAPAKHFLIEAKREGRHFTLPAGWSKETIKIADLIGLSDDLQPALDQAATYSQCVFRADLNTDSGALEHPFRTDLSGHSGALEHQFRTT